MVVLKFCASSINDENVNNIDGIFLETHTDPSQAKSDGANMLNINNLEELLKNLLTLREASSKI